MTDHQLCRHASAKGHICNRPVGHTGLHRYAGRASTGTVLVEWNDAGETRAPELGAAFECHFGAGENERQKTVRLAIDAANSALPAGTVYELRVRINAGESAHLPWAVAWYAVFGQPAGFEYLQTPQEPLFLSSSTTGGVLCAEGGYVLLGRLST